MRARVRARVRVGVGVKPARAGQTWDARGLARTGPCGHQPLQKPTRGALLYPLGSRGTPSAARLPMSGRGAARSAPAAALWCRLHRLWPATLSPSPSPSPSPQSRHAGGAHHDASAILFKVKTAAAVADSKEAWCKAEAEGDNAGGPEWCFV